MTADYVLTLADPRARLETTGGKGASLARLAQSGLPVPGGFHVTTAAYREFVSANRLQPAILDALRGVDLAQVTTLETAASAIRNAFLQARMPEEIAVAVARAYQALGEHPPVAVRSSATAEDLPEASFAGQQETYLNIHGIPALLDAVQKCWASLWTARAIAYRIRNQVDQNAVALAVVVQELVFADAAGILFTANPTNGRRDETLINAAWGLGEAVVSGAVTPDTVILDKAKRKILRRETAEKQVMTIRTELGTVEQPVPADRVSRPVLSDRQSKELARLGEQIEALYGMPMDVEWALARGKFAILQARPITNLPPAWTRPDPSVTYTRGSLAEHLPNPVTPLFGTLGLRPLNKVTAELVRNMGIDAEAVGYQYRPINGYIFMGFKMELKSFWPMLVGGIKANWDGLHHSTAAWQAARAKLLPILERWENVDVKALSPGELLRAVEEIYTEQGRLYTVLQASTLPAATSAELILRGLYRLVRRKGDPELTAFLFGFDTVPMQAERALYDLAAWARGHPALADALLCRPATELRTRPEEVPAETWAQWQFHLEDYLRTYGATVYSLDFANPTPAETPEVAVDVVQMYLRGQGQNPYERQQAARAAREQAEQRVLPRLRWPMKRWFERVLRWAQDTGPARENSLVDLGRANPLVRRMLGELGSRLAAEGAFDAADEIYWLEEAELADLVTRLENRQPIPDHRPQIAKRKEVWQAQMKLTPPAVVPEKSGFAKIVPWHKTDTGGSTLKGYGASAGKVTAPARVLLSPADFGKMQPGDILVAVTTTPAWTPLFAMASAVVTDIGGPLSHSSIVAREYGIPAVMAAGLATRKIQDGQIITVDGSAGLVILEPGSNGRAVSDPLRA